MASHQGDHQALFFGRYQAHHDSLKVFQTQSLLFLLMWSSRRIPAMTPSPPSSRPSLRLLGYFPLTPWSRSNQSTKYLRKTELIYYQLTQLSQIKHFRQPSTVVLVLYQYSKHLGGQGRILSSRPPRKFVLGQAWWVHAYNSNVQAPKAGRRMALNLKEARE